MATTRLSDPSAQSDVSAAVRDVEALTSAEVVVVVRPRSGHYQHTDWLVGSAFAFIALLVFLFWPVEFNDDWMPLASVASFVLGAALSATLPPLRRALTSPRVMRVNVQTMARATFVEANIARTMGRTGILVYVSLFERGAEVVFDVGVDRVLLEPHLSTVLAGIDASVRERQPLPALVAALRKLGPLLATTLPHREDDVNELPDEPAA